MKTNKSFSRQEQSDRVLLDNKFPKKNEEIKDFSISKEIQ